ncbi:MAG: TIGR00266 family protein [Spirochaetes bacterium GWF1_31_7]|nr:MAG: TIGR00266 family protein [Spirochaetes bacterium GWE1_32_154]OHD50712.1 MAG: TIGR00266 family protein [Spirochaetes bacterium GWE2_31_10]OHD50768.1 MAG: TIGR00266 family protein [Spirochaetes bacterium GWF1_31_7]OHD73660.1 MAG: TIGR00266 family protein [Spirochaetes bacterium RIFOXYB1_FULL_32_8]HBD95107.1 TIGR00266 family protein [Spirochaetia bacterium]
MKCHEIDYKIEGDDLQLVIIELDPGETVIAEGGSMMYLEEDIVYEAKLGDGSDINEGLASKIFNVGKRLLTRESLFLTHFTNKGSTKRKVAFAGNYPGKIIPVNMATINNYLICQKDAFLCAAMGTKIDIEFTKKFGAGIFGGEGFILQKIIGDGMAFIHAGGHIIEKELKNETLRVDTGCLVAFEPSLSYDIQAAGNLKTMVFGGEGIFLAQISGTGRVWLQSLPISRLMAKMMATLGSHKGEGSVIGGLSNIFEKL